jgi:ferredoxin
MCIRDRCRRYGTCEWEAPELFQLKPNGGMRYRRDVLPDQLDRARAAVRACPTVAIVLAER